LLAEFEPLTMADFAGHSISGLVKGNFPQA